MRIGMAAESVKKTPGTDTSVRRTGVRENSFLQQLEEAALTGSKSPLSSIQTAPRVPYGHLARDGVITYNEVQFVCDEKTNSICLGDMTDPRQVINIPLSGGGHLKVNRANLGQLSKAIGMFSPEDVNRILRAIHLDTRVQSIQKEVEDLEANVGERLASDDGAADTEEKRTEG